MCRNRAPSARGAVRMVLRALYGNLARQKGGQIGMRQEVRDFYGHEAGTPLGVAKGVRTEIYALEGGSPP